MRRWTSTTVVTALCVYALGAVGVERRAPAPTAPSSSPAGSRFELTLDTLAIAPAPATAAAVPAEPVDLPLAPAVATSPAGDVAIAPPPATFSEPAPPPAPPPAPLRTQSAGVVPTGGTWAVMIGINDYPGRDSDLRSAVNDALDVNEALARMGVPGDNRLLIRDTQATASTILAAADWLAAHAGPDAVAVFFYGGHVRKVGSTTEAIVGADGRVVTDAELGSRLERVQAKRGWLAVAACFGGGFTEAVTPGWVLTGAAGANSLAYENSAFNRSYMVQYMVREAMIENKASGSVQQAFAYARHAIARDGHANREPVQVDRGNAPLDLRPAAAGRAPQGSPSASPPRSGPPSGGGSPSRPPEDDGCQQVTLGVVSCRP